MNLAHVLLVGVSQNLPLESLIRTPGNARATAGGLLEVRNQ